MNQSEKRSLVNTTIFRVWRNTTPYAPSTNSVTFAHVLFRAAGNRLCKERRHQHLAPQFSAGVQPYYSGFGGANPSPVRPKTKTARRKAATEPNSIGQDKSLCEYQIPRDGECMPLEYVIPDMLETLVGHRMERATFGLTCPGRLSSW